MQLFTDIRARGRINEIKVWWNQYVHFWLNDVFAELYLCSFAIRKNFAGGSAAKAPVLTDTPLARMMAQLNAEAAAEAAAEASGEREEQAVLGGAVKE